MSLGVVGVDIVLVLEFLKFLECTKFPVGVRDGMIQRVAMAATYDGTRNPAIIDLFCPLTADRRVE